MPLGAARADEDDLGAQSGCGVTLDRWSVLRHDDNGLHAQRPRRIRHALRVVAAGVGDDTALAVFLRERGDLVVGAAKFESADGLLVFGLEEEAAWVLGGEFEFDQRRMEGDAVEAGLGGADVVEGYHRCVRSDFPGRWHD